MKARTKARSVALQVLFELDVAKAHKPAIVFETRISDETFDAKLIEFAREIVFGVNPIEAALDKFIAQYAPEWPVDQVAIIDRNILRIALWEFAVKKCTPVKVAINEAVELAKIFGSDSSPRFVNGVLGSLAEHKSEVVTYFEKL
ncbi:MAG: transcription antitermination factor NusB [Anaerolineaceae bacterium]|nr:transcription antitermination factor NusB [Anaerolineaceae bacterium]